MPRAPAAAGDPTALAARAAWIWGAGLVLVATAVRLGWVLAVPTVPVSDFAMYRESANYLSEFGALDHGFIYMPGFVVLLAWIKDLGGDLLAQKIPGVLFGGLGAAGLYILTANLVDHQIGDPGRVPVPPREGLGPAKPALPHAIGRACRRWLPAPAAVVATAIYALWPAGVAMSSVVGTDVPAAALIVAALAGLTMLAPRRPWTAALVFGASMGVAAWMRAVALPLTALVAAFWIATRAPLRRVAALTATAVAATLVVLSPWAARNLRHSGALYFTDDHGGITALIGANPNSEGTYTRALNQMFHDLTGRSVLDEPHHEVDRAAYGLAREWVRFEPAYALGLAALKAERLFDPERRLLYWPIFRPGVLVGGPAGWFAARRDGIGEAADAFGLAVAGLALAGVAVALARRRWLLLALLPFPLALAATYTVFFAEPRYRLPIEMLALPFVALALIELGRAGAALARRDWRRALSSARGLGLGLALVATWRLGWPALIDGGARLRARHRWAVTEWLVEGRPRLCKWRPAGTLAAQSPLDGAPDGVRLRAAGPGPVAAEVELGGGPLAPGSYALQLRVEASGGAVELAIGPPGEPPARTAATPAAPAMLEATVRHGGGALRLAATLSPAGAGAVSAWISEASLRPAASGAPGPSPGHLPPP